MFGEELEDIILHLVLEFSESSHFLVLLAERVEGRAGPDDIHCSCPLPRSEQSLIAGSVRCTWQQLSPGVQCVCNGTDLSRSS